MVKVTKLPFDPGPAAWNAILPLGPTYPELSDDRSFDVAIIGAGFAGLSAARQLHLLDPTLSIALIEARAIAEGPQGRNSGFMIDLPHNLASSDYAGESSKDRIQTALNRQAIDFAGDAVEEYGIPDEAYDRSGKINAAATEKGVHHNKDYAAHLEAIGESCDLLDARQMQELCGAHYYLGGLYTPGTAMLQPALYVREFASGLSKTGIEIFENSPVTSLEKRSRSWVVQTGKGAIKTSKVVLTNNGHVESFGFFERRLIHIYLYASMTRPLGDDEDKALGGEPVWGFTPADPMGSTIRKISGTGGTRIVIRNGISWAPDRVTTANKAEAFKNAHDQSFVNRFPMLKSVEMDYRWGGLLCLSRNNVSAFGELQEGLFSAACQNGLGTAMGTLSGMAIAEKLLGKKTERAAFFEAQDPPQKLPPEPFASLGAKATFLWGEWKAGRER